MEFTVLQRKAGSQSHRIIHQCCHQQYSVKQSNNCFLLKDKRRAFEKWVKITSKFNNILNTMKASLILKRPIKQELFYTVRPSKVFLPSVFDHNHKYAGLHYLVMRYYIHKLDGCPSVSEQLEKSLQKFRQICGHVHFLFRIYSGQFESNNLKDYFSLTIGRLLINAP